MVPITIKVINLDQNLRTLRNTTFVGNSLVISSTAVRSIRNYALVQHYKANSPVFRYDCQVRENNTRIIRIVPVIVHIR